MHRRARHLNPKAAGASLVLDARFITGLNNGDAISTWTEMASANDFTQTGTQRPIYTAASIGGNPASVFDGSNDVINSISTIATPPTWCIFTVFKSSSTGKIFYHRGDIYTDSGSIYLYPSLDGIFTNGGGYPSLTSIKSFDVKTFASDGVPHLTSHACDSTHTTHACHVDGAVVAMTNGSATNNPTTGSARTMRLGAYNSSGANSINGAVGAFVYLPVYPSSALRRRIEQSLALTWKIACS